MTDFEDFGNPGYDHTKVTKDQLIVHLEELESTGELRVPFDETWKKAKLVVAIEKHHALIREERGTNKKDYLKSGFEPRARDVTIAHLRQIFSQYDIAYPSEARKPKLLDLFYDNIELLRELNRYQLPAATPVKARTATTSKTRASARLARTTTPVAHQPITPTRVNPITPSPTPIKHSNTERPTHSPSTIATSTFYTASENYITPDRLDTIKTNLCITIEFQSSRAIELVKQGRFREAERCLQRCVAACLDAEIEERELGW